MLNAEREEFNRRREEIRRESEDPTGENRRALEAGFREAFGGCPLFSHVTVRRVEDPGYHLRVFCTASHEATVEELEAGLRRMWLEELRHPEGLEAHVLERGARSLVLDCITAPAPGEHCFSVRVRVEDVPLEEASPPDGSDAYLVALFGGDDPEGDEKGGRDDGGIQPRAGGSDRGGDGDLEHLG